MLGMLYVLLAVAPANPFDRLDQNPVAFAGPAKLIITWYQSGLTAVDYPSQAKCEQARMFVEEEVRRRLRESAAAMPAGAVTIGVPANGAFCIPG
jgi:hypothetical protein